MLIIFNLTMKLIHESPWQWGHAKHQSACVTNSQRLEFILNTNKETVCRGRKMVLGEGLTCEHIGVRNICCRSTMVLGKWLPCEHIGVRHIMWQENWWSNSTFLSRLQRGWVGKNDSQTQARRLEGNHERVWYQYQDLGKDGHLEDRTLFDVTEEKTFS